VATRVDQIINMGLLIPAAIRIQVDMIIELILVTTGLPLKKEETENARKTKA